MKFGVAVFLLLVGPLVVGCDEGTTKPDAVLTETEVSTTDAQEVSDEVSDVDQELDLATGCAQTGCIQPWEVCNNVTDLCVKTYRCLEEGAACVLASRHLPGLACVPDGEGGNTCVATCDSLEMCDGNEFCVPERFGDIFGSCTPANCESYWDGKCGSGAICLGYSDEDLSRVCLPLADSPLPQGATCHSLLECENGLLCIFGTCEVACDPSGARPCSSGLFCQTTDLHAPFDVGVCTPYDCEPFATVSSCAAGEKCNPAGIDATANVVRGRCESAGAKGEGGSCTRNSQCGMDLQCLAGTCQSVTLCDVTASGGEGACAVGRRATSLHRSYWGSVSQPSAMFSKGPAPLKSNA